MLLFAAVAIAAATQQGSSMGPVAPRVQARVTIRILSGAMVRFGQAGLQSEGVERITTVHAEGLTQPAKLLEFQ